MRRRLSTEERFFSLFEQAARVNFAITARVAGQITERQLREALAVLKTRHPLMAVRMGELDFTGGWLSSEGVPDFPIRIVETSDEQAWTGIVEEELQRTFSFQTGPLTRFALVHSDGWTDLIVVCQHGIADGLSGAYLLRNLLRQIGGPAPDAAPADACRIIGDLVPPKRPARPANGHAADGGPRPKGPLGPGPTPQAGAMALLQWSLDQPTTEALRQRCRAEQTTVHAALTAAFLRAFVDLDGETTLRRVETPVNLRPRLTADLGEEFGLYVTILETSVECAAGRTFWEVARAFRQDLQAQLDGERYFDDIRKFTRLSKLLPNAVARRLTPPFTISYDISITNLGALDFPLEYGPLRLEALYGPSLSIQIPNHRVLGVACVGGRICFSLASLDRGLARQLKECAMRHLLQELLSADFENGLNGQNGLLDRI
jgi:hypothetical protein